MRLLLINFNNVLGLNGHLNFVEGKPLLIYGENIAGKSNIINMLRYCLIPKWREKKGYAEEKRLKKNEILLHKNSSGTVEIYFEQNKKFYRLYYYFLRKGKNTRQVQKMFESDATELPMEDEERIQALKNLEWKDLGISTVTLLKEKLVEIGIYPEIIDILISPSNVRNFSEAIGGKVVRVPEIIAAKISNIHTNVEKYQINMKNLHDVLILEREEFEKRIRELRMEFENVVKNLPEIDVGEIFTPGKITRNLENVRNTLSKELELMPEKASEMRETLRLLSSEKYEIWSSAIDKIVTITQKKEELKSLIEKIEYFENIKETLDKWKISFQQLPPDSSPEGLLTFSTPKWKKFDFSIFSNPERIKSIFLCVEEAKRFIQEANQICNKYKVPLKIREINGMIKSYDELFKALKTPLEPEGDPALISRRQNRTVVSIPLDVALSKVEYLRGIEPTPLVHRPEKLSEKKFKEEVYHVQTKISTFRTELREAKKSLSRAKGLLKKIKQLKESLIHEIKLLERNMEERKKTLSALVGEWNNVYHHLCEVFKLTYENIDLSSKDLVDSSLEIISKKYREAQEIFAHDLAEQLKNYPEIVEKYRGQKPMDIVRKVTKEFEKIIEKMTELQREYKKVNEWILSNNSQIKSLESRNKTREIMTIGLVVAQEILSRIQEKTDIKKIIEELAEKIEENVRNVYSKIFPEDESFSFKHLKEGQFLTMIKNEPITHPSGSQRVAVSVGIMLSLAETFNLPMVLDEAFDRKDVRRLKFFCECYTSLANDYQICLAARTSYDIEKNPEVLSFINNWKIYLVERAEVLKKNIRPLKGFFRLE